LLAVVDAGFGVRRHVGEHQELGDGADAGELLGEQAAFGGAEALERFAQTTRTRLRIVFEPHASG